MKHVKNIFLALNAVALITIVFASAQAQAADQVIYLMAHCKGTHCPGTDGKYLHSNSPEGGGTSWGGKRADYAWAIEYSKGPLAGDQLIYLRAHCKGQYCPGTDGKYLHSNSPEGGGTSWGGKSADYAWRIYYTQAPGKAQIIYLRAHCKGTHCPGTDGNTLHSNSPEGGGTSWGGKSADYAWVIKYESQVNTGTQTAPKTYKIGDKGPAGGIVFRTTDGGLHGVEISRDEISANYNGALRIAKDYTWPSGETGGQLLTNGMVDLRCCMQPSQIQIFAEGRPYWYGDTFPHLLDATPLTTVHKMVSFV